MYDAKEGRKIPEGQSNSQIMLTRKFHFLWIEIYFSTIPISLSFILDDAMAFECLSFLWHGIECDVPGIGFMSLIVSLIFEYFAY